MNTLDKERATIDSIDREMAKLFEQRMKTAGKIAEIKKCEGLAITDATREKRMIEQESACVCEELRPHYTAFLKSLIKESKNYQVMKVLSTENANTVTVPTSNGEYSVHVGWGILDKADEIFDLSRKVLVVTDDGVPEKYAKAVLDKCQNGYLVTIPEGEQSKNLKNYAMIEKTLLDYEFDRGDAIVAVGGGVVGDLAGFVSATFKRGIDFYNVPTTLLAQVDSAVGGKVAIDFEGIKNAIGTFYPPCAVLIDLCALETLDERQFASGMAEVIKIFATYRADLFEKLEKDELPIENMVVEAIKLKAKTVTEDEKENGIRRVLNFGHTVGHAVESVTAESKTPLLHGECVGLGMLCMSEGKARERIAKLLKTYGLPTMVSVEKEAFLHTIAQDKKTTKDGIITVRVSEIGKYSLQKEDINAILTSAEEVLDIK